MIKKLIALVPLSLLLLSFNQTDIDKKAKAILNNVSKTYKSYKTLKVDFSISSENKIENSKTTTEKGVAWLKGDKFKIKFNDQTIYCNGNTMWTHFEESKEVHIEKYNPSQSEINVAEIFTMYQKGFLYKYDGQTSLNKQTYEKIKLTPEDKKKPYFQVELFIETGKHEIHQVDISFKNGIKQFIKLSNQLPNENFSNKMFEFSTAENPGITVVDLR